MEEMLNQIEKAAHVLDEAEKLNLDMNQAKEQVVKRRASIESNSNDLDQQNSLDAEIKEKIVEKEPFRRRSICLPRNKSSITENRRGSTGSTNFSTSDSSHSVSEKVNDNSNSNKNEKLAQKHNTNDINKALGVNKQLKSKVENGKISFPTTKKKRRPINKTGFPRKRPNKAKKANSKKITANTEKLEPLLNNENASIAEESPLNPPTKETSQDLSNNQHKKNSRNVRAKSQNVDENSIVQDELKTDTQPAPEKLNFDMKKSRKVNGKVQKEKSLFNIQISDSQQDTIDKTLPTTEKLESNVLNQRKNKKICSNVEKMEKKGEDEPLEAVNISLPDDKSEITKKRRSSFAASFYSSPPVRYVFT